MRNIVFQIKYIFLQIIRDKIPLFWLLAFPFILTSVFYAAFNGLDKNGFSTKIGIEEDSSLVSVLENVKEVDLVKEHEEKLRQMLLDDDIDAYLNSDYEIVVADSSIKGNIAVSVIEQIRKYSIAYIFSIRNEKNIPLSDKEILALKLKDIMPYIEKKDGKISFSGIDEKTSTNIDYKTQNSSSLSIILFTSIAMFALYGVYMSTRFCMLFQGYLSDVALRISSSPYRKIELVISSFIVTTILNLFLNILIVLYIDFVLGNKLFTDFKFTFVIFLVANFFAIGLGTCFGMIRGLKIEHKTSITTIVLLFLSFLCGMDGNTDIKNELAKISPLINKLNPVNLVNESLYQANIIGNTDIIANNLYILAAFGVFLFIIAGIFLRRQSYDSL